MSSEAWWSAEPEGWRQWSVPISLSSDSRSVGRPCRSSLQRALISSHLKSSSPSIQTVGFNIATLGSLAVHICWHWSRCGCSAFTTVILALALSFHCLHGCLVLCNPTPFPFLHTWIITRIGGNGGWSPRLWPPVCKGSWPVCDFNLRSKHNWWWRGGGLPGGSVRDRVTLYVHEQNIRNQSYKNTIQKKCPCI